MNYDTEDSLSTIMGNSDQSLNSDYYRTQSHDNYHRQCSGGSTSLPYHHDSGHYDEPPSSYSSGSPHAPGPQPWGREYQTQTQYPYRAKYTSGPSHTTPGSHPSLPPHLHNVPPAQYSSEACHHEHSYTSPPYYPNPPSHGVESSSRLSGYTNGSPDICPYAIAHSSDESDSEAGESLLQCVCVGGGEGLCIH